MNQFRGSEIDQRSGLLQRPTPLQVQGMTKFWNATWQTTYNMTSSNVDICDSTRFMRTYNTYSTYSTYIHTRMYCTVPHAPCAHTPSGETIAGVSRLFCLDPKCTWPADLVLYVHTEIKLFVIDQAREVVASCAFSLSLSLSQSISWYEHLQRWSVVPFQNIMENRGSILAFLSIAGRFCI